MAGRMKHQSLQEGGFPSASLVHEDKVRAGMCEPSQDQLLSLQRMHMRPKNLSQA